MNFFKIGFQLACGWYIANITLGVLNLYIHAWITYFHYK